MAGSIEVSEEKGVRYLHFGSDFVQGAMRIARPWALELEDGSGSHFDASHHDPGHAGTLPLRFPDQGAG